MLQPEAYDEELLDFPVFEPFEPDDRPLPPDEEDFPVGCMVDLVDIDTAKVAQTAVFWEPFMDRLFKGKTKGLVKRHVGDYTLIECEDPDDASIVTRCTLYRACLKEPKVKMKKYIPHGDGTPGEHTTASPVHAAPPTMGCIDDGADEGLFPVMDGNARDVHDPLELLVAPTHTNDMPPIEILPESPNQSPTTSTPPATLATMVGSAHPNHHIVPPTTGGAGALFPPSAGNASIARKLLRRGNVAYVERRNEDAIRYYTEAYEIDKPNAARILSNRSAVFLAMRNADAALADARVVMRLAPKSHVGYVRTGNVFRFLKRFNDAKVCYEKALALDASKSPDLQYSLRSNAVAAVYHNKTERIPVNVHVNRQLGIDVVAKRDIRAGDVVWTEATSTVVPLHVGPHVQLFCAHCFRSLIRATELSPQIPGVDPAIVASLMRDVHPVGCHEGCDARYCSESCRMKAWTEHHWIECSVKGRWSAAMPTLRAICKRTLEEHMNPHIVASTKLALRMMIKVMSSGKHLSEAINTFSWVKEQTTLSPEEAAGVQIILQPAYMAIHSCLTREERGLLDFSFMVGLYQRARRSMVPTTASPWPTIISNVETNLSMIRQRGGSHPGLESMLSMDPSQLNGVSIPCYAIFEIYSLVLTDPTDGRPATEANVVMRRENETANTGVFTALCHIPRNGVLAASR